MRQLLIALALFAVLTIALAQEPQRLTLDDCVRLALQRNPRLAVARYAREIQLVQLERERPTGLHPEVKLQASQTLTTPQVHFPNAAGPLVTPFARPAVGVTFSQTVLHFGARKAGQRAQTIEKALDHDRRKVEAEVVFDVKKVCFNLQTAIAMVAVARDAVKQVEAHLKVARAAVEAGMAMPLDVKRAELELANLQSGVVKAENGVALALANLNRQIGRGLDEPLAVAELKQLPDPPAPLEQAVATALKQRHELSALRETIKALETSVGLAKSQKLPTAAVRGGVLHQRDSAFTKSPSVIAALEFSLPLFDHKTALEVREVRARLAQMQSQLIEAETGIALEVRQAWLNVQEARYRVGALPTSIAVAAEALRIAELRFANGRALHLEVTDARLQHRKARADLVQAEFDLHSAAAELEKATGATR